MSPVKYDSASIEKIDNGYLIRLNSYMPPTNPDVPPSYENKTIYLATIEELADTIKNLLG